jgi:hypothetical protein
MKGVFFSKWVNYGWHREVEYCCTNANFKSC